jgi:hypothetical protein
MKSASSTTVLAFEDTAITLALGIPLVTLNRGGDSEPSDELARVSASHRLLS